MRHTERNVQTEAKIKNAFITMVDEKGINKVTIADIARQAGISRGTFYVHYVDKYDLLEKIESEIFEKLQSSFISEQLEAPLLARNDEDIASSTYRIFNYCLAYIDSERETLRVLLSPNGDPYFFNRIKDIVDKLFTNKLSELNGHFSDDLPISYSKEISLTNLLNIVRHWLNSENPETPEELAEILMHSRLLAPRDLLVFDEQNPY
ncbi:AcrR family transcriptional regulator [Weissella uvarum]|uniref:TetR/AcrR family transcriptional regulator n=1 Tax=Weissella uvarum TaxID=1479233 RepID=UPI001960AEB5|nr:TetR/AcrR family transcriptional regulator [Weissella uvarum]MBM7618060.1 AcrR family transcriptional regulator [Weissella uvarum]MCM0595083.1 TetR/AcrR family transcriptional regulator [Weissella uvarum]